MSPIHPHLKVGDVVTFLFGYDRGEGTILSISGKTVRVNMVDDQRQPFTVKRHIQKHDVIRLGSYPAVLRARQRQVNQNLSALNRGRRKHG